MNNFLKSGEIYAVCIGKIGKFCIIESRPVKIIWEKK